MQNVKTSLASEERPFLRALFDCLDPSNSKDDHMFIFALCLIYAIVHNKGKFTQVISNLLTINVTLSLTFTLFNLTFPCFTTVCLQLTLCHINCSIASLALLLPVIIGKVTFNL